MTESIKTMTSQLYNMSGRWLAFITVAVFLFATVCLIKNVIKGNYRFVRRYWNIRECMVICACFMIVIATFCDDPNMGYKTWVSDTVSVNFIPETTNGTINLDFPIKDEQGNEVCKVTDTVEYRNLKPGKEYNVSGKLVTNDNNAITVQEDMQRTNVQETTSQNKEETDHTTESGIDIIDSVESHGLEPSIEYTARGTLMNDEKQDSQTRLRIKTPTEIYKTTLRITFFCGMGIVFYLLLETAASAVRRRRALSQYTKLQTKPNIFSQHTVYCSIYALFLLACISKLTGSIVAMSIFVMYITVKRFIITSITHS